LSNACFSLALAIVATVAGAKARRPHLAHMLWLLVFIKLVTPPIVTIPIVTIPAQDETAVAINDHSTPGPQLTNSRQFDVETQLSGAWNHARVWLPPIWLLGSMLVFVVSMVRICRFSRLLAAKSNVAPQELQTAAVKIASRLGLNRIPTILTTSASLSPMVWWTGGKVRIVIPTALLEKMDAQEWQWVLAHELAHVRRRDYMVRWLEWLACVCFWWNPVVWWAQRNLRATEEICCDNLVISCLSPKPKFYANSLLSAVEFLARPVLRPPAMASEINSGGFLERRFKMIVSEKTNRSNSRWVQGIVLVFAMVVLPFGIASAQDYKAVEKRLGEAVSKGELSLEQASVMMDALKKAGGVRNDQGADRAEAYLMKVKKELGELVEAGSMSKEDAAKRYEGAEKGIRERMAAASRLRGGEHQRGERRISREDYAGFERRIKAAVREGKMTRVEAGEQLEGFRRRLEMAEQAERSERGITVEEYKRAEAKMQKMVEEGKAKPEDVERRLIEMRKMISRQRERGARSERERGERRITVEEYRRAEEKMRKMVEEDKAKPEDVKRRLGGMRRMMAAQGERQRGGEGQRTTRGDKGDAYEGFERRIKAAVEAGRMTREEAKEKLDDYKKRIGR
ncbi:MAG: M48 family metalloprotease, partial [Planctomycetes bacterium]|nr:M48 family metalloprotease [Planctomycetota bacterium]